MSEFDSESARSSIEATRALLMQKAAERKCVHPFRLMASNAFKQVLWLAAVELGDDNKARIVNISGPEWGLAEFPITFELEDANGTKLIANVNAPEREYLQ